MTASHLEGESPIGRIGYTDRSQMGHRLYVCVAHNQSILVWHLVAVVVVPSFLGKVRLIAAFVSLLPMPFLSCHCRFFCLLLSALFLFVRTEDRSFDSHGLDEYCTGSTYKVHKNNGCEKFSHESKAAFRSIAKSSYLVTTDRTLFPVFFGIQLSKRYQVTRFLRKIERSKNSTYSLRI
jgi:hypothetical protein